ncbi:MAG: glycosyl transferase [Acidobacteria bacterium]|nr:MAG: glycosyl transferase [Acidobacteriota bacterium]
MISATESPLCLAVSLEPRPAVKGKFLWAGEEKFVVRGVTYGPFRRGPDGSPYPVREVVDQDFADIASNGFNAVRTYDVPPRWLLDLGAKHGLRIMVGLQVEQRISFLDDPKVARQIKDLVRSKVRGCAGHPAVLCYVIANEIPASIVRWHGAKRVERFLRELYRLAKDEDPEGLFSYANYPTTEYLDLHFLDLVCFNVYLESQASFEAYLARLQTLAGNRPLLMTEMGLDSQRNGRAMQAQVLDWQIRSALRAGSAGAFVFAWTDEWFSRGQDVEDWDFGLTDRARRAKPALDSVERAFREGAFPADKTWPRISVLVCTFNGKRTLRDCLDGLAKMRYPNYEVIVVDDGSKDGTAAVAREYRVRVISTPNRGLSAARNTGLEAATGEIVAYTDDDTRPDPDWLSHLATVFMNTDYVGVGGPNIPFPNDGPIARSVARAPGGPTHVLLSDTEAEHIPGCNMAFRKASLEAVGGFDPQFRVAGDDVDVCWRLRERGGRLGFSPGAVVWHHYRNSVRAYWRQQKGYGKAEALLEKKWPEKYNSVGHITWGGRIYGGVSSFLERGRGRIYFGTWGTAAYTRLYAPTPRLLDILPLMPERYLIALALGALGLMGFVWKPLWLALPLAILILSLPLVQVVRSVWGEGLDPARAGRFARLGQNLLTVSLDALQPLARLWGRLAHGLAPWRRRSSLRLSFPRRTTVWLGSRSWEESPERLEALEAILRARGAVVRRGGDYDTWDLEVEGGLMGDMRLQMASEVDGGGHQLVRARVCPAASAFGVWAPLVFIGLATAAAFDRAPAAAVILGGVAIALAALLFRDCAGAASPIYQSLRELGFKE